MLLDRGTDREREDILGREEGAVPRELDPEFGLLLELLDEDEDDELLRLVLAIDTGSASNITASTNNSPKICFGFDSLMIKPRIKPYFQQNTQLTAETQLIDILA